MAYKIKDIYPSQVDTNDVGFPDGKPRNIQGGIQGTGTPFEEKLFQDYEGARQALFAEAGIDPSGVVDRVGASDFVGALKKVANQGLVGKIFQSPTDDGLTEIQTRTVGADEVYEVRKVSDDSLATIYSDKNSANQIEQNGTSNVSGSDGVVTFYIADGDYTIVVGAASVGLSVGVTATNVETSDGRSVQERLDDLPSEVDAAGTAEALIGEHNSDAHAHPELSNFITTEADRAEAASNTAVSALLQGDIIFYEGVAAGIAGTSDGGLFWTMGFSGDPRATVWVNNNGVADKVFAYAGEDDFIPRNMSKVLVVENTEVNTDNKVVFEFDFVTRKVLINQFRAQYGSSTIEFSNPLTLDMPISPNRAVAIVLDVSDVSLSIVQFGDLDLSDNEYIICTFHENKKIISLTNSYSINGVVSNKLNTNNIANFTPASGPLEYIANFDFENNAIYHETVRVIHNGMNITVPAQTIALDAGRNAGFTNALVLDVDTLKLTSVIATSINNGLVDNVDLGNSLILYYFLESRKQAYTTFKYKVNGADLVGEAFKVGGSKTMLVENTSPTASNKVVFEFDFTSREVTINQFRGLVYDSTSGFNNSSSLTMPISSDLNRSIAIIVNVDSGSFRMIDFGDVNLSKSEYVICTFHENKRIVSMTESYSINGVISSDIYKTPVTIPYTLSTTAQDHLCDVDTVNRELKTNVMRVLTAEGSVNVPAQTITIPTDTFKTWAVLFNKEDSTLSINTIGDISEDDIKNLSALYFFNTRLFKVYTQYPYKYNGVLIDNTPVGTSLDDTVIFNESERPSLLMVSDSHLQTDPVPLTGAFTTATLNSADVYAWFDDLVTNYPDYVSKEDLGFDESGIYPIYGYKFTPPKPTIDDESGTGSTPRVSIMCIHAETLNFVYVHVLMREICNSWAGNDRLAALRFGVEFYILPCAHPWGMDNKSRLNVNGVDINRNFNYTWVEEGEGTARYSGPSAESEQETKTIMSVMNSFKPHVVFDCHAFHGNQDRFIWVNINDLRYRVASQSAALQVYQRVIQELPALSEKPFTEFYRTDTGRTTHGHSGNMIAGIGAVGGTMEVSRNTVSGEYISNEEIIVGASNLMNVVYESLKAYKLYGRTLNKG